MTSPAKRVARGRDGSSPALDINCPRCAAPAGRYCVKADGSIQVIAHMKRRSERARKRRIAGGYPVPGDIAARPEAPKETP